MLDIESIAQVLACAVKEATEPLQARIAQLEARKSEPGITGALIGAEGTLVFTRSDGSMFDVGRVVGKDGQPGRNGLSADDVHATVLDDGRTVEFSIQQGDYQYSFELAFPVPMYRGTFAEGQCYEKGDFVTFGGSLWHCNAKTGERPGGADWQLAVKKGRDGQDAK